VRKDGEHNPEATAVEDHPKLSRVEANVHALALGYFLTRDEGYAERAALQLRIWFLNPATRMNPNLQYAQAIRGSNEGRGAGILDAEGLTDVVDALALLSDSKSWTASDEAAMHAWFRAYFDWLTTSANGKNEAATKNNHGSWYDAQAVGIALYLGKTEFARNVAEAAKTKRIAEQIRPDGQEPLEETRTRSFHYSIFNIQALMKLAAEAQTVNVDLWSYQAPGGGSIRAALDYLLPFADKQKTWEHQELDGVSPAPLHDPLLLAAVHYGNYAYEAAALKQPHTDVRTLLLQREFAEIQKTGR
jgi:Alginate lyase